MVFEPTTKENVSGQARRLRTTGERIGLRTIIENPTQPTEALRAAWARRGRLLSSNANELSEIISNRITKR